MITLNTTASESYQNCLRLIARHAPLMMRVGAPLKPERKKATDAQREIARAKLARGWRQDAAAEAAGLTMWQIQQMVKGDKANGKA